MLSCIGWFGGELLSGFFGKDFVGHLEVFLYKKRF